MLISRSASNTRFCTYFTFFRAWNKFHESPRFELVSLTRALRFHVFPRQESSFPMLEFAFIFSVVSLLFCVWHHLQFLPRLGQVSRPLHLRDLFQHKALVSPLSGQFWWREISLTYDFLLWSVLPAVVFKLVTSDHEINIIALALCDYLNFFIPETPIHEPISIFYSLPRLWNTARWATSGSTSRSCHRSYELWRSVNKPWGLVVWNFSSSSWIPNTDR